MKHKVLSFKSAATTAILAASIALMTVPVYADIPDSVAAGTIDIKKTISRAINLVMAFVVAGGIINIVLGVRNLAQGVSDDGGGQDQQKISKGKGQLISGIIMVGAIAVMKLLGLDPNNLLNTYLG